MLPRGLFKMAQRAEEYARGMAMGGTLFEEMGFYYVGPIDGHNLDHLVPVLENVRDTITGPVLIHVVTRKGHGYAPAETAADKWHAVNKFTVLTGEQKKSTPKAPTYQKVFGESLIAEARKDPAIVVITAAMPSGTGVDLFEKVFPERTFDVGIAEQHGVTFAAGMATEGMKPFCAIYSTFLQRGYDQVVHDVAIQKLPVRFAMDRAGLVGADGATHAGSFDLAYLTPLPGFVIMAPSDEAELVHMVATAAQIDDRPSAIRYPRGEGTGIARPAEGVPLEIGKGRIVKEGGGIAILNFGARMTEVLLAAERLNGYGLTPTIADARFCKPLDTAMIRRLAKEHEVLITIEEGAAGGFGAHVMHFLAHDGLLDRGLKMRPLTLPGGYFPGSRHAGEDVCLCRAERRRYRARSYGAVGAGPRQRSRASGRKTRLKQMTPTARAALIGFAVGVLIPLLWGVLNFALFGVPEGAFSRAFWTLVYITCPFWVLDGPGAVWLYDVLEWLPLCAHFVIIAKSHTPAFLRSQHGESKNLSPFPCLWRLCQPGCAA